MPFMTHPLVLRPLTTVAPSTTVCALTSFGQLPPETRTKTLGFLPHLRIGAVVIQSAFPLSKKTALTHYRNIQKVKISTKSIRAQPTGGFGCDPGIESSRETNGEWQDYLFDGEPLIYPFDVNQLPPGEYRLRSE
jgi:hypothetical protein